MELHKSHLRTKNIHPVDPSGEEAIRQRQLGNCVGNYNKGSSRQSQTFTKIMWSTIGLKIETAICNHLQCSVSMLATVHAVRGINGAPLSESKQNAIWASLQLLVQSAKLQKGFNLAMPLRRSALSDNASLVTTFLA